MISTQSSSFLASTILNLSEVSVYMKYKLSPLSSAVNHCTRPTYEECETDKQRLYWFLNKTSRSFATVTMTLDEELRYPICLFYLILRGLDTVEDDRTIPIERRLEVLKSFHKFIYVDGWNFLENHPDDKDAVLLQNFHLVIREFQTIPVKYQQVIAEITRLMGEGMAEFSTKQISTIEDFDLYCHYVAGLVGIGLSRLFSYSELEEEKLATYENLSNSMGLFLQKNNIIRDYLNDLRENRVFWPKEIWGSRFAQIEDLALPEKRREAVQVLNEMCMNALAHVPHCLKFMSMLKNESVFRFCAIPQVMAVSQLALLYNNPEVFERPDVKIRRGKTLNLILETKNFDAVKNIFAESFEEILSKVTPSDANYLDINLMYGKFKQWCVEHDGNLRKISTSSKEPALGSLLLGIIMFIVVLAFLLRNLIF